MKSSLVSWLSVSKFLGFNLCWFLGFTMSWFLGFEMQSFEDSMIPYYPKFHFQDFIRWIVGIVRRPSFPKLSKFRMSETLKFMKRICFENDLGFSLDYLRYPGVSKDRNNCFGSQGHVQKNRNHIN